MKRFLLMLAAVALFAACNKEGVSEEGQWFCYERGEQNARFYMELKDGQADFIITAWGTRYTGPYTYNAQDGKLTINYTKSYTRYVAMEEPDKATLVSNLFNDWPGASEADHVILSSPIEMDFTLDGDNAHFAIILDAGSIMGDLTRKK